MVTPRGRPCLFRYVHCLIAIFPTCSVVVVSKLLVPPFKCDSNFVFDSCGRVGLTDPFSCLVSTVETNIPHADAVLPAVRQLLCGGTCFGASEEPYVFVTA